MSKAKRDFKPKQKPLSDAQRRVRFMRWIIALLLIPILIIFFVIAFTSPTPNPNPPTAFPPTWTPTARISTPVQQSSCPGTSLTCSQLTCGQAYACLRAGNSRLDGDGDGVPCESICGGG